MTLLKANSPLIRRQPLPRWRHALSRRDVREVQRSRIFEALTAVVAKNGYVATTVEDISGSAGVSRKTFYEYFRDKEECFLAAYDWVERELNLDVAAAIRGRGNVEERLRAAYRAYLGYIAARPAKAVTFIVEIMAAGPRAHERRAKVHAAHAEGLRRFYAWVRNRMPQAGSLPDEAFTGLVGAVHELISERVTAGQVSRVADLEDPVVFLAERILFGHGAVNPVGGMRSLPAGL